MTIQECDSRDKRFLSNIQTMLNVHDQLCNHAKRLRVTIENTAVVIRGELPTAALKSELVPAIRRAGVLSRVCDYVRVPG